MMTAETRTMGLTVAGGGMLVTFWEEEQAETGWGWEYRRMWQFGRLAESRGRARGLGRWVGEWVPASGGGRPRLSCMSYRATEEGLLPRGTGAGKAHLGDMTPETAPCLCVLLGDRVLS